MSDPNWPPRFTLTAEGAVRLILANYGTEKNEAKTELALLMLVNEAYAQGKRDAAQGTMQPHAGGSEGQSDV